MVEPIRPGLPRPGASRGLPVGAPALAASERRAVTIPATILCPDGDSYACVIRDMSPVGATLAVSHRYRLPREFTIEIAGREGSYPVRRSWQRGDLAEVTLVVADPAA